MARSFLVGSDEAVVQGAGIAFTAGADDCVKTIKSEAAALQSVDSADPINRPVLLRIDRETGHGLGKPLEKRILEMTDLRVFLMWQLGMLEG